MTHFLFYLYTGIVLIVFFYFLKEAIKDAINNSENFGTHNKLDEVILEQKKTNFYLKIIASKTLNLPKGPEFDLEHDFYKTLE